MMPLLLCGNLSDLIVEVLDSVLASSTVVLTVARTAALLCSHDDMYICVALMTCTSESFVMGQKADVESSCRDELPACLRLN